MKFRYLKCRSSIENMWLLIAEGRATLLHHAKRTPQVSIRLNEKAS
jgi:hypothetical protein